MPIVFSRSVNNASQSTVCGPWSACKSHKLEYLTSIKRTELKYSLKIAFMFVSIILKCQVLDTNILLGIRKKATVFDGPWSADLVVGPQLM